MSADNWAQCPQCHTNREQAAEAKVREVKEAYGVLPLRQFDALRADADLLVQQIPGTEDTRTFREDYEIYGAEDGIVHVRYSGSCSVCGLRAKFSHDHPLPLSKDPQ